MINDFAISRMSLHLFQAVVSLLRRANRDIGNEHPKHHFSGFPYLSSCRTSDRVRVSRHYGTERWRGLLARGVPVGEAKLQLSPRPLILSPAGRRSSPRAIARVLWAAAIG